MENNDYQLETTQKALYKLTIDVANSKISKKKIANFFKKHTIKIDN